MLVIFRRWSHVGRRPVPIDSRAAVELLPQTSSSQTPFGQTPVVQRVKVSGPFGCLEFPIHQGLTVSLSPGPVSGEQLLKVDIDAKAYDKMSKYCRKFVNSMWGTTNSVLRQHIEGVTEGYQISLRLVGVGYKASVEGNKVDLKVGYTHDILLPVPAEIKATTPIPTRIVLNGSNYQSLTQFAAKIRSFRKPEPYNGKGIFVGNETIALKEGKKK